MKQYLFALFSIGLFAFASEPIEFPLHKAAQNCQYNQMSVWLYLGVDANMQDRQGRTPLMIAAKKCSSPHLLLLLKHGADINFRDKKKRTALNHAANACNVHSMEELVKQGADVSVMHEPDDNCRTPFQKVQKDCGQWNSFCYGVQFNHGNDLDFLKANNK